ncbi:MAG: hypothetical protein B6244_06315 [Candidatus Cloacimonetes bacterium 4572_55]|nr:MAG: hypothetical protein B6244_06315 [Candidatus Cloacimonetes bacterium 4572_55]
MRFFHAYQGLTISAIATLLTLIIGSVGFMAIEGWSFIDSFYMTIITLSTVGYGEVSPLSHEGRLFTIFLIVIGTVTIFVLIGVISSYFLEINLSGTFQRKRMLKKIEKLKDHYVICGAGSVGEQIIARFCHSKIKFVVVEQRDEEIAALFEKYVDFKYFVLGDATDEDALNRAGIESAKGIITTLATDADNLFVTITAKDLSPGIKIVSRAVDPSAVKKLRRAGAHHVISPNIISGERMAAVIIKPNIVSFLDTITTDREDLSLLLEEVELLKNSRLVGMELSEAGIPRRTGLMVIAIKSGVTGKYTFNPLSTTRLNAYDVLIVLGTEPQIANLKSYVKKAL